MVVEHATSVLYLPSSFMIWVILKFLTCKIGIKEATSLEEYQMMHINILAHSTFSINVKRNRKKKRELFLL